jgi:peroxiredoxin
MKILTAYLVLFLLTASGCNQWRDTGLAPGKTAPSFSLPDLRGNKLEASDLKGKVAVINFWASWCAPCIEEMPALERMYNRLLDKGLVVIGIAVDDNERAIRDFVSDLGLTFPILLDSQGLIRNKYKVTGYPETFIIDREGKMVMILDPSTAMPAVRMLGPRDWDAPEMLRALEAIL